MKILSLDLRAFGPFTRAELNLADGREGLHLVFGPNEAGKSSALRALRQMLFGIDERTTDRFLHDYDRLRVGGTLRGEDGSQLAFLRRKGRRKVLRDLDDARELDDAALDRFLGGLDVRQHQALFSIDHDGLVAGGREIVKGEGEVGELVFGAGTDLRALRALQKQLKADYESLFRPRGENYPINRALVALETARREVDAASIQSSDWHALRSRLDQARVERESLDAVLHELRRRLTRLERIRQALPDVARLRELNLVLDGLADAPRLPDDFAESRRAVEDALRDAARRVEVAEQERDEVSRALERLVAPGPILDDSAAIEALADRLGVHLSAQAEIASLRLEREGHAAIVRETRLDLGLTSEAVLDERLRVPLATRQRIDRLLNDHQVIVYECKDIHKTIEELSREVSRLEDGLRAAPSPIDFEPLRLALRRVAREGDLSRELDEARAARSDQARLAQSALKTLKPWSGTLDEFEAGSVPTAEAVESFRESLDQLDREREQRRAELEEAESQSAIVSAELDRLQRDRDVPGEPDLRAARARRDLGWRLIKAQWKGGEGADPEALRSFAGFGGDDLASAFERSLSEADLVADRLRSEADRINEVARLQSSGAQISARAESLREALGEAEQARATLLARWLGLWAPLGFEPGPPKSMQAWLTKHAKATERVEALRDAEAKLERIEARHIERIEELSGLLATLGEPVVGSADRLPLIFDQASGLLERLEAASQRRAAWQEQLREAERKRDEARAEEAEVLGRLRDWQSAWEPTMRSLGLDPSATRDEVTTMLDRTGRLADALAAERSASGRIEGHEAERLRLDHDAQDAARRLAPELLDKPCSEVVATLRRLLVEARDAQARRETLTGQRDRQLEAIRSAREAAELAADRLASLVRLAGCQTAEGLPEAEARSLARRAAESERAAVESRLRHLGGGATLSEFLDLASETDPDALPAEIERLEEEISERSQARTVVVESIGREQQILDNMEETAREARADAAAGRVQGLLAEIESRASDYVRKRLTAAVLREAIERYRERSQGPVLRRAGTHFARLTCGSFESLQPELDDDGRPHLVGVRPGGAPLAVQGMSEGTCDALYLALKLSSLEHHLDHHPAMPLVLDDIFVNLDDDRAREGLKVLAELSRRTQILFFTHHRHLVELAEMSLAPDVLFTHELRGERESASADSN